MDGPDTEVQIVNTEEDESDRQALLMAAKANLTVARSQYLFYLCIFVAIAGSVLIAVIKPQSENIALALGSGAFGALAKDGADKIFKSNE